MAERIKTPNQITQNDTKKIKRDKQFLPLIVVLVAFVAKKHPFDYKNEKYEDIFFTVQK